MVKRRAVCIIQHHSARLLLGARVRRALLAAGLLMLVATAASAALAQTPRSQAQETPRLASLEIAIWPEYDRPEVLVLLRGELAADVPLPTTVSVSIPASSGGPSAVASAATADSGLLTRDYEVTETGDSLLLTLTTPDPLFHVEFYDLLPTDTPDRTYTYTWPGDLATDSLTVQVQEPLGATGLSVEPELGPGTLEIDGLVYRGADMGAFEAGQTLTITVRYRKTDPRTSVEILAAEEADSGGGVPSWLPPVSIAVLAVVAVAAVLYWRSRRQPVPASQEPARGSRRPRGTSAAQAFCTQCGHRLAESDRFCARCGNKVRGA